MKLSFKQEAAIELLKQRNFAYLMVLFLMGTTGVLLAKLWSAQERIIVIPSLSDANKRYLIEGEHVPDSYLVDWASNLLSDLFTANPQNVDRKTKTFLSWAISSSTIGEDLKKTADLLKKEQISTAFFPETFSLERKTRKIHVTGRFLSFFGKSHGPTFSEKTFVMGWRIMPSGAIVIETLEEERKDDDKKA